MQSKITVLLLGTNGAVATLLLHHQNEYTILQQKDHENSLVTAVDQQPHIVIVICDDLSLCRHARHRWPTASILILSKNGSEQRIARALDLGADDYVTIPFGEDEFLARMRALFRRVSARRSNATYRDPDPLMSQDKRIALYIAQHRCIVAGQEVHLTATEFELLRVMMIHSEKVLSHRFLLQQVWGPEYSEESDYLRVYLHQLRGKIELDPAHPQYIVTKPGAGYVFRDTPT